MRLGLYAARSARSVPTLLKRMRASTGGAFRGG